MEESAPKRRRTSPRPPSNEPAGDAQITSPQRNRPRRPSWASPTKASMSRWNPQILERRRSASPPKSPDPTRSPARRGPSIAQSPFARLPTADTTARNAGANSNRVPVSAFASSRPGVSAASTRSPARPIPRPLPPPGPEGEDDFNPFAGRTIRRSPRTGVSMPPVTEPELPPSPNDPVSSTPPRGIHASSSPSRRKSKTKPVTSSPLKQPPSVPGGVEGTLDGGAISRKLFKSNPPAPSQLRHGAVLGETTDNVRRLPKHSENSARRRERDELRAELARLQKDLDVTARNNERIRAMQETGLSQPLQDRSELMRIINRHLLSRETDSKPAASHMLTMAALDPMAILPFGKPAASVVSPESDATDISDVKSHHPVPMTAKDELPFLQLFTPFDTTWSLAMFPQEGDEETLRQLFTIRLRSRRYAGLFSSNLEMVVDALKFSILDVGVTSLEPAAKAELGPFLRTVVNGDCNRSMQRNIGIMTWAMAEWLQVAERRGRFWARLRQETATKDLLLTIGRTMRVRRPRRPQQEQSNEPQDPVNKQDLLRFMGDQSFDIDVPAPDGSEFTSLRLNWKIDFDWTGEAKSSISVMIGVPGKWHKADRKGAFGQIPLLFDSLVQGGEDLDLVVRKMIALLVGQA